MTLTDVLHSISLKPVGTEYITPSGDSVKKVDNNAYELYFIVGGSRIKIRTENGFKPFVTNGWERKINKIDFGTAINLALKDGKKVTRMCWPDGMYVTYLENKETFVLRRSVSDYGNIQESMPYVPVQKDMIAKDWYDCAEREDELS